MKCASACLFLAPRACNRYFVPFNNTLSPSRCLTYAGIPVTVMIGGEELGAGKSNTVYRSERLKPRNVVRDLEWSVASSTTN